jgi:hypothetical protein
MLTAQNNLSRYSIIFTGFISLLVIYFFVWRTSANGYHTVIDGDGRDYYAYLKAIFIDKNLGHQDTTPWYVIQTPTGTINVHTVGVSLLLLPFFLIAYVWASWFGYDVNGLSAPFEKMISIGALFYALLGLYFIRKLLLKLNIKDVIIALTLLLIFFGTHLLNYSLNEPAMSHVYSFSFISAFMYFSYQVFNSGERKYFVYAAISLGLVILIRPINGIILSIVPFWSDSFKEFIERMKHIFFKQTKTMVIAGLLFKLTILIQAFVWLAQNGKMMQWSYKDNGLYLFSPNALKMLFGFNAGFFIYTPVCLLLMLGFVPLFKENSYKFFALFLFLIFVFYLFSCHWAYTYFDGLSIRPMVDLMPVFAILGAKLISSLQGKLRTITVPALGLLLVLNLVTCYQYKAGILPPASMNYEKFKYIFLKTDKKYAGILGGCNDLLPYAKKHPEKSFTYESPLGEKEVFDYNNKEYGLAYQIPALGFNSSKIHVKASLQRRESTINSSEKALICFSIESTTSDKKNTAFVKLNDTPSETCGDWQQWNYNITLDAGVKATDRFVVYVWNPEKQNFLVKDFKVEVYDYNYKE